MNTHTKQSSLGRCVAISGACVNPLPLTSGEEQVVLGVDAHSRKVSSELIDCRAEGGHTRSDYKLAFAAQKELTHAGQT